MLKKNKIFEIISLILFSLSGIVLIGMQNSGGWVSLGLGILSLLGCRKDFARDISLIYISLIILAVTDINTHLDEKHMILMTMGCSLAIAIPYFISKYIYKDYSIRFSFFNGRTWHTKELFYLFIINIIAYFLIPFYFQDTYAHLNWTVTAENNKLYSLFLGTNSLGIWDELFFISTLLGILRKWMPFKYANLIQAILFSSFLYELGFIAWGALGIFIFALVQGVIFRKTKSLFYMISIHLSVDLILFLALIHAHYPDWASIFIM